MDGERKRNRSGFSPHAIKLSDVALKSGVSSATVSRALNYPDKVSKKSLRRVQAAIAELAYLPNSAGRALASSRTHTLGAVIPTLSNPVFASGVEGFETTVNELGYSAIVSSTDYHLDREERQARILIERGAAALMLMGAEHQPGLLDLLAARNVPFVNTWIFEKDASDPCIGFDNRKAAGELVDHLLDFGHRRFALLSGFTKENDRAAARVAGVRQALLNRGVRLEEEAEVECDYSVSAGRDGFRRLFLRADPKPTAVICGNDLQAFGALFEAQAMGLEVARDISITGFDDIELASHIPPGLTTMHVPTREMGVAAGNFLVQRLTGQIVRRHQQLDARLVVRGSTGPAPAS